MLYEVSMPERLFRTGDWIGQLKPSDSSVEPSSLDGLGRLLDSVYETGTPLLLKATMHLGSVCRPGSDRDGKSSREYELMELSPVVRPKEGGEYLHPKLSFRRIFLYENVNARKKTGLVGLFVMEGGSGERSSSSDDDLSRPQSSSDGSFELSATCHFWVVKPGGKRVQKSITARQCEGLFGRLLAQLRDINGGGDEEESSNDYSCLSPESNCAVANLSYVSDEAGAFAGANDVLNKYLQSNNGPTLLMSNTARPDLRKLVPTCNSFPMVPLAFPPGPAHDPSVSSLPALNWEPTAVQLCLEAYIHAGAVSFPRRVSCARFSRVPLGNLGRDENASMFDVLYARNLTRSRAALWASDAPGRPDLGSSALAIGAGAEGGVSACEADGGNEIWSDDGDRIGPVIQRPGVYRCVCVELDVFDLSIAALTDPSLAAVPGSSVAAGTKGGGGGALFDTETSLPNAVMSPSAPLGDEMSAAVSLPVLRSVVLSWLKDACQSNSRVADDLLHDVYRLVSSPDVLLNDPALHRVVHALMRTTFLRLLGELQRLGSTIVSADFHRVVIATGKSDLFDAREYVEFVISTILKRAGGGDGAAPAEGLGRISLRPNGFYSHYLFLDRNNFGGVHFEHRDVEDDEENELARLFNDNVAGAEDEQQGGASIVPTVVCGWNIMQYLANDVAQDYFRTVIGRFSKDVFRKQLMIEQNSRSKKGLFVSPTSVRRVDNDGAECDAELSPQEQLLAYKRKMISKHFANYLTRAVGELIEDGGGPETFPQLPGSHLHLTNPALEFVKNVLVVLDLDPDTRQETTYLRKSLFAQVRTRGLFSTHFDFY